MQELSTYKDWQVPLVSGSQCIRAAQPAENYVGDGGGDDYDVDDDEKEVDNYVDDDVGDGEVHQLNYDADDFETEVEDGDGNDDTTINMLQETWW